MRKKENFLFAILGLILILIDQIFKAIVCKYLYKSGMVAIKGILNITYVENTGGAYGIGTNKTIIFTLITFIIVVLLIIYFFVKNKDISKWNKFSFILIISGGIGNLIDRLFRGYVVDYIDVNPIVKFPMFNFADMCIVIGCIIIIFNLMLKKDNY